MQPRPKPQAWTFQEPPMPMGGAKIMPGTPAASFQPTTPAHWAQPRPAVFPRQQPQQPQQQQQQQQRFGIQQPQFQQQPSEVDMFPVNTVAPPMQQQQLQFQPLQQQQEIPVPAAAAASSPIPGDRSRYVREDVLLQLPGPIVTVFGASGAAPDQPLYKESQLVGARLARAGYVVLNGGYSGTMEGSAKGAKEAGGQSFGVVVPTLFRERHMKGGANPYLTGAISTRALLERLDILMHSTNIFVVLPGQLGTLQELTCIWSEGRLAQHFGPAEKVPKIFAWRNPWKRLVSAMVDGLGMPCDDERLITFVDDVDDLMRHLQNLPNPVLSPATH